jgi:hypothetical protein
LGDLPACIAFSISSANVALPDAQCQLIQALFQMPDYLGQCLSIALQALTK